MKLRLKSSVSLSWVEDGCRGAGSEQAARRSLGGTELCEQRGAAPCASPHPARGAHRGIATCAEAMAHKPQQIPLLQALISRPWSFDARESRGQIGAAAVSVRSAFPGLTTLPPSAAAGKGTDLCPGGSGSRPPPRESPRRCGLGRCFPFVTTLITQNGLFWKAVTGSLRGAAVPAPAERTRGTRPAPHVQHGPVRAAPAALVLAFLNS